MRRFAVASLFTSSLFVVALPACESDPKTPGNDSSVTDTSGTDITVGQDVPPGTDVPVGNDTVIGERTVKSLQEEAESVGCNDATAFSNINPAVTVANVVVTSPQFTAYKNDADPTKNLHGYYVADQAGGPWSGILVTIPVAQNSAFVVGDVLTVSGQLVDYFCNTQISADTVTKTGTGTAPAPLVVSGEQAVSEALEGVVVTLEGVEVVAKPQAYSLKAADGTMLEAGIDFGRTGFFVSYDIGATYNLTGVMKYGFSKRQLMARGPEDIVKTSVDPEVTIKSIQSSTQSTACSGVFQGPAATLTGTVATAKFVASASNNLDGYYLTDGTNEPFSGIQVVISNTKATNFVPGDVVTIAGNHSEYFCMTQFFSTDMTKTGDGGALPAPVVLEKTVTAEDLEKYEGMLVELSDINVAASNPARDDLRATDAGVLHIDNGLGVAVPAIGAKLTTLRGVVRYAFDAYRVSPRSADDIVVE